MWVEPANNGCFAIDWTVLTSQNHFFPYCLVAIGYDPFVWSFFETAPNIAAYVHGNPVMDGQIILDHRVPFELYWPNPSRLDNRPIHRPFRDIVVTTSTRRETWVIATDFPKTIENLFFRVLISNPWDEIPSLQRFLLGETHVFTTVQDLRWSQLSPLSPGWCRRTTIECHVGHVFSGQGTLHFMYVCM